MSTLIQTNQYNADKENLEESNDGTEKEVLCVRGLVTTTVLNTKIGEFQDNIPDV